MIIPYLIAPLRVQELTEQLENAEIILKNNIDTMPSTKQNQLFN